MNIKKWDETRNILSETVKSKTRNEWQKIFDDSDGCVAPVVGFEELYDHPHNKARQVLVR